MNFQVGSKVKTTYDCRYSNLRNVTGTIVQIIDHDKILSADYQISLDDLKYRAMVGGGSGLVWLSADDFYEMV